MCFNTVILNFKRKDISFLLSFIKEEMKINNDGFSLVSYSPHKHIRTLSQKEFIRALYSLKRSEYLHIHLRKATSGDKSIKNVHMWQIGKYHISHNGIVSRYCREKGISDTKALVTSPEFIYAIRKKDAKKLKDILEKRNFYGVMFLTNKTHIIIVSKGKSAKVTYAGNILVFSNDPISITVNKFGIEFEQPRAEIENGIYLYNIKEQKLKELVKFIEFNRFYREYYWSYGYGFSRWY